MKIDIFRETFASVYAPPVNQSNHVGNRSVYDILKSIHAGEFKAQAEAIRSVTDKKQRNTLKSQLPYFTPQCVFGPSMERKNGNAQEHTGFVILDLDGLDPAAIPSFKQMLRADPYCAAAFTSISGNGLCVLYYVEPPVAYGDDPHAIATSLTMTHKQIFKQIKAYFESRYQGVTVDVSGSNIARIRYVSYDPEMVTRADPMPFPWEIPTEKAEQIAYAEPTASASTVVKAIQLWMKSKIDRMYRQREAALKTGKDVSGFAHHEVLKVGGFCGGFHHIIGEQGKQELVGYFMQLMAGKPNHQELLDRRKFLEQYEWGAGRPMPVSSIPTSRPIELADPTKMSTSQRRSCRMKTRQAMFNGYMKMRIRPGDDLSLLCETMANAHSWLLSEVTEVVTDEVERLISVYNAWIAIDSGDFGSRLAVLLNAAGMKYSLDFSMPVVQIDGRWESATTAADGIHQLEKWYGISYKAKDVLVGMSALKSYEKVSKMGDWVEALPQWDGKDHIAELARFMDIHRPQNVIELYLKIWLTSAAKQVIEDHFVNRFALVFVSSKQAIGKSKFFNTFLCPPELYAEGLEFGGREGDMGAMLQSSLIVNLEEFTGARDVAQLKKVISMGNITGRAAYGRNPKSYVRRASFAICTNETEFLVDTENTRFLTVELNDIDWMGYTEEIDPQQVWAQAFAWARDSDMAAFYNVDHKRMMKISELNEQFVSLSNAHQFMSKYFTAGTEPWLLADVQAYIEHKTGIRSHANDYKREAKRLKWPTQGKAYLLSKRINPSDGQAPELPELPLDS